jgi:hypothetical protein
MLKKVSWRELTLPALAFTFTAHVVYGMLLRLPLSAEMTDEALTAALPYRFVLGDRPFIDEINSAQTAGPILTPIVWLYLKVVPSTSGIILFMRMLFLVGRLALAATVFATVKRHLAWPLALVTSLVCVVFVPYSVASPNYLMGSGFRTACTFVAVRRWRRPSSLCAAGLASHPKWSIWVLPLLIASLALGAPNALSPQLTVII